MRRRPMLVASIGAVLVAIAVIVGLSATGNDREDPTARALHEAADTFPVPPGATVAFPDTVTSDPHQVTKGWRSAGSLDAACAAWREAYRSWVGQQQIGSVTGEFEQGQSCSLTGDKDTF